MNFEPPYDPFALKVIRAIVALMFFAPILLFAFLVLIVWATSIVLALSEIWPM